MNQVKKDKYKFIAYYFIYYMATVVFNSFVPLYYREAGLSDIQIGMISSVGPAATMLSMFVIGRIADKMKNMNYLICGLIMISAGCTYLYTVNTAYIFLMILSFVYVSFNAPIIQLSDVIAVNFSLKNDISFGSLRIGASFGYCAMSIICGILAAKNSVIMFYLAVAIYILSGIIVVTLPHPEKNKERDSEKKVSYFNLFKPDILLLIAVNFFTFIAPFYYNTYFLIHLKNLEASDFLLGIAVFFGVVWEVPFMLFAGKLTQLFSVRGLILLSTLFTFFRYFGYGFFTNPLFVVLSSFFGICAHILVTYVTAMYLQQHVDSSLRASAQTLIGFVNYGVGKFLSNFLGGLATETFGIPSCFKALGIACLAMGIIYYIMQGRISKKNA